MMNCCADCTSNNILCYYEQKTLLTNSLLQGNNNGVLQCNSCLHPINHHINLRKYFIELMRDNL